MKLIIVVVFTLVSCLSAENDVFMNIFFGNSENITIPVGEKSKINVQLTVYHNGNRRKAGVAKIHSTPPIVMIPTEVLNSFPNLEYFDASNNKIRKIEQKNFELMPNLRVLNLGSNKIKFLPAKVFAGSYKLFSVLLNNNTIEKIYPRAFEGLRELFSLRLSHNKIKKLLAKTFIGTPKLITLDLFANEIEEIHPLAFQGLTSLAVLILDYNRIKILPANIFDPFQKDYHIYLTYNQIVAFPKEIFNRFDEHKSIRFEGNYCVNKNFDYSIDKQFDREDFLNATLVCNINYEQMKKNKSAEKSLSEENRSRSSSQMQSAENAPKVVSNERIFPAIK